MKNLYTIDMLGGYSYRYPTDDEIIKKTAEANRSDLDFAKQKAQYLGYKSSLAMTTSELFKPITESQYNSSRMKTGSEATEIAKANIQSDPNISVPEKLALMNKLDQVKLEHFVPKTEEKKSPHQQRIEEADKVFRLQNDQILGVGRHQSEPSDPVIYSFGIIELFSQAKCLSYVVEDISNHHQIIINYETGKIQVAKPLIVNKGSISAYAGNGEPEVKEYNYSRDLMVLLTVNTVDGITAAKDAYIDIVDFCLRDEFMKLKTALQRIQHDGMSASMGIKDIQSHQLDLLERLRSNVKFVNWFSTKYGIPLRLQADRATKSGVKYTSPDTSFNESLPLGNESLPLGNDPEETDGEGIRFISISPNSDDRIKRLAVLLGYKKSSNTTDPKDLAEFTGILDTLLNENKVTADVYKRFMKLWKQ